MRKVFLGHISLLLIIMMLCSFGGGVCAVESSQGVSVGISFDKASYKVGDTAKADISVSGISSLESGDKIGSFEAYIKYNSSDLCPVIDGVEVTEKGVKAGAFNVSLGLTNDDFSVFDTAAEQMPYLSAEERLIVCSFEKNDGITLDGDSLNIGSIDFKIKKDAGAVGVSLTEVGLYRPYSGSGGITETVKLPINISGVTGASATVNFVAEMSTPTAVYNQAESKVSASVTATVENSGVVIAQLFDKSSGLTKATKVISVTKQNGEANAVFENVTSSSNLQVRIFLWSAMGKMVPLCENKSVDVQ